MALTSMAGRSGWWKTVPKGGGLTLGVAPGLAVVAALEAGATRGPGAALGLTHDPGLAAIRGAIIPAPNLAGSPAPSQLKVNHVPVGPGPAPINQSQDPVLESPDPVQPSASPSHAPRAALR